MMFRSLTQTVFGLSLRMVEQCSKSWNPDGRSITVRGVEITRVDGKLYSETIDIRPFCGNTVKIMVRDYEDQS